MTALSVYMYVLRALSVVITFDLGLKESLIILNMYVEGNPLSKYKNLINSHCMDVNTDLKFKEKLFKSTLSIFS